MNQCYKCDECGLTMPDPIFTNCINTHCESARIVNNSLIINKMIIKARNESENKMFMNILNKDKPVTKKINKKISEHDDWIQRMQNS